MKLTFATAICALLAGGLSASAEEAAKPSWMYVLTAGKMTYANGKLTLGRFDRTTLAFSERPFRMAHHVRTASFISTWAHDSKPSGKPNGSIAMTAAGQPGTAAIELQHPRIGRNGLTFDVAVLDGKIPASATSVSLFVDAFPSIVSPQITD
jgi:hypothetical protein